MTKNSSKNGDTKKSGDIAKSSSGKDSTGATAQDSSKKSSKDSDKTAKDSNKKSSGGSSNTTASNSSDKGKKDSGGKTAETKSNSSKDSNKTAKDSSNDKKSNDNKSSNNSDKTAKDSSKKSGDGSSDKDKNKNSTDKIAQGKSGQSKDADKTANNGSNKDGKKDGKKSNDKGKSDVVLASATEPSSKKNGKDSKGKDSKDRGTASKDSKDKKDKKTQTVADKKAVDKARDESLGKLDKDKKSKINDKLKKNEELASKALKSKDSDKKSSGLKKALPALFGAAALGGAAKFGAFGGGKGAKFDLAPVTPGDVAVATGLANKPGDPAANELGQAMLSGKPLTNEQSVLLDSMVRNTTFTPGELASFNKYRDRNIELSTLVDAANTGTDPGFPNGIGNSNSGGGWLPGFLQVVDSHTCDHIGLPQCCCMGPTVYCPCEPTYTGPIESSSGYCMSMYCETPPDYTDPNGYMVVNSDYNGDFSENLVEQVEGDPGLIEEGRNGGEIVSVAAVPHHTRYLRVANISGAKTDLFLQYYTQDDKGNWDWYPARPDDGSEPFAVALDSGEATDIMDGDWRVNASKVRIWAKSEDGKVWDKFKDADLELVPEADGNGTPTYLADTQQTFCFTIK